MKKQESGVQNLIPEQYYSMLRDAITKHGKLNVRSLSRNLGIQDGNTYFRHFIENKNQQQHLGFSGLTAILERFGYEAKIVIKEKTNTYKETEINSMNDVAIKEICLKLSEAAKAAKKPDKVEKISGSRVIQNADVVMRGIMGASGTALLPSDIFGDDDDDELEICYADFDE